MPVYKHLGKNSKTEEQKKEEQKKKEEEEVSKKRREEMDAEIQKKVGGSYLISFYIKALLIVYYCVINVWLQYIANAKNIFKIAVAFFV